ncbi:MAG: carboxypeptidase regulatory-like domain-containing protein, partial [Bacteroidetes bacterium]|nr:carboxypeptidase regulatory-like domain-containing protein [Bacteroidota bacterium]
MRPRTKLLLSIVCTLIFSIAQAQTIKLSGKVLNEKNEPLAGVSIKVTGDGGTTTDLEGRFTLNLSSGKKYVVNITAVGYNPKEISDVEVTAGQVNELNIVLEVAPKTGENVIITATRSSAKRETIASAISFQRNTNTVAQVVSAESIRRSPDKNTGEVLKRVPGASIQDGKYLVVRGLADRYNQTMLNGILLSSTEPDRKTFSFDILPSSIIDNIVINKAFVPEFPGEWAGGLIQVNTKDVPSKDFFNVQVGTGFNVNTIGKDFYAYKGGGTDFLGFDNGFRALPSDFPLKTAFSELSAADKTAYGKKLKNIWTADKQGSSFTNSLTKSVAFDFGFNQKLGSNTSLAAIFAVNYNNSRKRLAYLNQVNTVSGNIASNSFDYSSTKYSEDILEGALANFTLQIGKNNKISVKNILNINTTDYSTIRSGFNNDANHEPIRAMELAYKENTFFNTQVSGDHNIVKYKVKFHWFGSFNILDQYIPDQRRLEYRQENPSDPNSGYIANIGNSNSSQKSGSRYFGFLNDYNYTAGGDLSRDFTMGGLKQSVKGGYFFQVKDRLFDSRPFTIYLPSDNSALLRLPADQIFAADNFGNGTDNKFAFSELPGDRYRYLANSILNAGFLQFDNQFTDKIRLVWGLRV